MEQQVTITTASKEALRPLVLSAIENEKSMLQLGIERTRERLAQFEERHRMSSEVFERRLNALELQETVDFTDWRMEIGMLRLLKSQYRALDDGRVDITVPAVSARGDRGVTHRAVF